MKHTIAFLLASLAVPALADQGYLTVSKTTTGTQFALNAAAATRTVTAILTHDGTTSGRPVYSKLAVTAVYVYSAATTVTVQFSCARDGTNYGRRTSTSTVAGASTIYAETGTYTTGAASINLDLEYDVRGCASVQLLFGGAGAGAGDLVTPVWNAAAGS